MFPGCSWGWQRESTILNNIGVLTVADGGILAMRCYLASQIQELASDIRKEGRTFQWTHTDLMGNEITISKSNPKTVQLKGLGPEYRMLGSLLGLDPSSRSRLAVKHGRGKCSKFDGLVKRR